MARYCLEIACEEGAAAIVHQCSCRTYNHASLLGLGRLANLGDFDNFRQALNFVHLVRPDATRCKDCCVSDYVAESGLVQTKNVQRLVVVPRVNAVMPSQRLISYLAAP
jgi:hypothetical protein